MASYSKPKQVNGVINTIYNSDDYSDQSKDDPYVNRTDNQNIGGLKTFTTGIKNDGNTIIGDADTDTLVVNAKSTFNAKVDLTNATDSVIPGKFIVANDSTLNKSINIATPNNITGIDNTFINSDNDKTVSGTTNIVIGRAGTNLTTGGANILIGTECGGALSSGSANIFIGRSVRGGNTVVTNSVCIGDPATRYGGASFCVAIGSESLWKNGGTYNTAIGANSGKSDPMNCTRSTFLGAQTSGNFSDSTAIGYNATITAANQMVFGIPATTLNAPNLAGTGNRALYVDPTGNFTTSSSDSRLKENIIYLNNSECLTKMLQLKPAKWDWIKNGNKDFGLIAQDIQTIMPDLVFSTPDYTNVEYDVSGNIVESSIESYLGINYHQLTPYLISSIQALNSKINDQNTMISSLMLQISSLMDRVQALEV